MKNTFKQVNPVVKELASNPRFKNKILEDKTKYNRKNNKNILKLEIYTDLCDDVILTNNGKLTRLGLGWS